MTGHSLGAAGVQETIYSLMMMRDGFVEERAHRRDRRRFADMPIVRERIDGAKLGAVLSNSSVFGGTNATLAFKNPDA
ncbi:3-oxoacyl-(acyl-carrier-protein) synthase [Bradyrhizobium sp. USDA 4508]